MIDFAAVAKESHATAVEKGWYEQDEQGEIKQRYLDEVCSLFHSEISEAVEELRNPKAHPIYYVVLGDIWVHDPVNFPQGRVDLDKKVLKPEGVAVELADLIIRLGDSCEAWNCTQGAVGTLEEMRKTSYRALGRSPVGSMIDLHIAVDDVYKRLQIREMVGKPLNDCITELAIAVLINATEFICMAYGWDLERAIQIKLAYNKTRPFRHGGKKA